VTQIAIITDDDSLVDQFRARRVTPVRITLSELEACGIDDAPRAVVVDLRRSGHLPSAVPVFCRLHPSARVALVVKALEPAFMLEAMRAGASECIPEPISPQALDDALRRMLADAATEGSGQLIALVGAKGGVGTTTLAVNTAAALAKVSGGDVLLVDVNIGRGDAALLLGADPRFSTADALENVHKVDASFLSGVVEKTASGVHLLSSGTDRLLPAIDEDRLRALLDMAARTYRVTVLDVPRADPAILNTLDMATRLGVVTTQELASLRHAGPLADSLRQRYGAARVTVILNRGDRDSVIPHADVERATGGSVTHRIPSDYRAATEAVNAGRPFVLETQNRLSAVCRTLARDLAGLSKERTARQSNVLTRFVLRRA
jgi:pilus assembly protein CpaE